MKFLGVMVLLYGSGGFAPTNNSVSQEEIAKAQAAEQLKDKKTKKQEAQAAEKLRLNAKNAAAQEQLRLEREAAAARVRSAEGYADMQRQEQAKQEEQQRRDTAIATQKKNMQAKKGEDFNGYG